MYKLNYVGKLEKHTPPKMIHQRPILQQLCPLSPWVEQLWSRARRQWLGLVAQWLVRLFGSPKKTHQKKERKMVRRP